MSIGPSSGFDPSPWIAANAALAARLGAGRKVGFGGLGGQSDISHSHGGSPTGSAFSGLASRTITGDQDEERRRRLGRVTARGGAQSGGGSAGFGSGLLGRGGSVGGTGLAAGAGFGSAGGSVSTASLLARGYQPAVVKVVSYAHGAARATASAQYVERDEVELETHDGVKLPDKEAVAEEIKAWSASFEKRTPSQDVVTVRVQLSGVRDSDEGRALLSSAVGAAFEGHRYAYRVDVQKDGILEARVVAVMARGITPEERGKDKAAAVGDATSTAAPSSSKAPPSQTSTDTSDRRPPVLASRIRVVEKRLGTTEEAPVGKAFDPRSEATMKARIETATGYPAHGVSIEPQVPGHGKEALGAKLALLINRAPALDHQGKRMATADDVRDNTRDWGRHLRSQTPRDTMHMVVSAKAGTDVKNFTNAVRSFLHDQFSDHKFMFGVHTDKAEAGHIHAHAIVAVRSESGTKLHPGPNDLNQWRVTYAAHARAHGLEVVATRAAEQASSRSYGPKDKAIVDVAETPRPQRKGQDCAYANDPRNAGLITNARERIATARANPIRIPETSRDRAVVTESLKSWQAAAKDVQANSSIHAMVQRLSAAKAAGEVLGELRDAAKGEVSRSATGTRDASLQRSRTENTPTSDTLAAISQSHNEHPAPMPKSAADMLHDLRLMNQRVADVSAMLPEGSRARFQERAASAMERIAERVDQQRTAEVKEAAQQEAKESMAKAELSRDAQQVAAKEQREATQAQRLVDRAVEAERKVETAPLSQQGKPAEIEQSRATVREAERNAAREGQEARSAVDAARSIADDPTKPVSAPPATKSVDPVAEIRRKQAEILERLTQERGQAKDREHGHEAGD